MIYINSGNWPSILQLLEDLDCDIFGDDTFTSNAIDVSDSNDSEIDDGHSGRSSSRKYFGEAENSISNSNNGNNTLVNRPKSTAKAVTAKVNIIKIKTTRLLGHGQLLTTWVVF